MALQARLDLLAPLVRRDNKDSKVSLDLLVL